MLLTVAVLPVSGDAPLPIPAEIDLTHDFATLSRLGAGRVKRKQARFRIVLDSADAQEGEYTVYDCESVDSTF